MFILFYKKVQFKFALTTLLCYLLISNIYFTQGSNLSD